MSNTLNLLFIFFLLSNNCLIKSSIEYINEPVSRTKNTKKINDDFIDEYFTNLINVENSNNNSGKHGKNNLKKANNISTLIEQESAETKKSQLTAFLLEFFLPIGAGHFYCGRIINGIIKLIFVLAVVLSDFIIKYVFIVKSSMNTKQVVNYIIYALYFLIIFWQLVDCLMFGLNKYNDGNGKALITMNE
jgi:hypothetical protein